MIVSNPYALRLLRPTGIVEHELVFMCTNKSTSAASYNYEGTNLLRVVTNALNDTAWIYVGADGNGTSSEDYSLGVFTNHGENASCWTNWMKQTPGFANRLVNGTAQCIDPNYFNPPEGSHLWIYANVDPGSKNTIWVKDGDMRADSVVLIVPQIGETYSTSVVYEVKSWYDVKSVVTNLQGQAGAEVASSYAKDVAGQWTLDISDFRLPDDSPRKLFVSAATRRSSNIPDAEHGGLAPDDPYYPAVMDWLQEYPEKPIYLAQFSGMNSQPVRKGGQKVLLSLKEMYWLDIPPVNLAADSSLTESEWILVAGMGGSATGKSIDVEPTVRVIDGQSVTSVFVSVTMMVSNDVDSVTYPPYPPYMLRGLEPGSSSTNYDERVSNWTSATFKVQGALQNGLVNDIWRPLRWFTLCPDSFGAPDSDHPFSRTIELPAPADTGYDWGAFPDATPLYRFSIDEYLGPVTIYQLNDKNALLYPTNNVAAP